jgi:hypothetical protein
VAKVKMLTSANRDGVALPNGSEVEVPEADAVALCRNGLASPVGWTLEPIAPPPASDDDEDPSLEDLADDQPAKPAKRPTKK